MGFKIMESMVIYYDHVQVRGVSQFLIKHITEEYQCLNSNLQRGCETVNKQPREENGEDNDVSQQAPSYKETPHELTREEYPMEWFVQRVDSRIK